MTRKMITSFCLEKLGLEHFKERIEVLTARQAKPKVRGADRKSKKFLEQKGINRV